MTGVRAADFRAGRPDFGGVDLHQAALTVQQGYATSGRVAPLKAAATKIVPVVRHHIAMLASM